MATGAILTDVKQLLMIPDDLPVYDQDLIIHINGAFATLHQLGVGPIDGFEITEGNEQWDEFLENKKHLNSAKSFVFIQVKLLFDPPTNAFLVNSLEKQLEQLTFRLSVAAEGGQNGKQIIYP